MPLFREISAAPEKISGLTYIPDYITNLEQQQLIDIIDKQPWLNDLKRRVQHYGYKYDYKARNISSDLKIGNIPEWIVLYTSKLIADGHFRSAPDQVIINEYLPGQGISPHIDCIPCFDETIASLSLGSTCIMEFINQKTNHKLPLLLEPGSLVILKEEARYNWQHFIPSRKTDRHNGLQMTRSRRISLTFRNVLI